MDHLIEPCRIRLIIAQAKLLGAFVLGFWRQYSKLIGPCRIDIMY